MLNCIVCDGLTLCWCFYNAGIMGTELGIDIEIRGVSSCDVSQSVQWVKSGHQLPYIITLDSL